MRSTTLGILLVVATLSTVASALQGTGTSSSINDLRAFDGEWIYVEDRTEGHTLEQLGPPMSGKFSLRVEEGAVILVDGHGSGHRDVRVSLDGSITEIAGPETISRYSGAWKDGTFTYQTEYVRASDKTPDRLYRKELRMTSEGMLVRVITDRSDAVGLYRQAADIPLPTPAKAAIGDLSWLAGAWVGTRGSSGQISFEERWSPPSGGAMLAASRTVSRGKMSAFEFLRIVERDGGLVYIAQPNGAPPTEFVLTELNGKRAVFDNPRHDYPKRIVYEVSAEGGLTATTGFLKGGTPRRFEFKRESN